MVLDSSAIVAIHLREPGHERLIDRIDTAEVVVGRPHSGRNRDGVNGPVGHDARPMLFAHLRRLDTEVVAFNAEHLDAAVTAFIRFRRAHHPAALNFGESMSWAVASVAGMPLLFTGEDFGRTDIAPA
ncbi:MAG TPA: type II toxin-antitoxin system VapC family toxin [Candidatus Acidoferrales bacterium]|nr:type II toxin-antitoxin system VapC family toxin [Candidatus Acidoferrales bacterium]